MYSKFVKPKSTKTQGSTVEDDIQISQQTVNAAESAGTSRSEDSRKAVKRRKRTLLNEFK